MGPENLGRSDKSSKAKNRKASNSELSSHDALEVLDSQWYRDITRDGRWMDLLGDYAGAEPFLIDGESLLQNVLSDPLIAIGRPGDPSFQILHAVYRLEQILNDFIVRSANFAIVFFGDNVNATIRSNDGTIYDVASRTFARSLLIRHLSTVDVQIHRFPAVSHESFKDYCFKAKPMFVMINDSASSPRGSLIQRMMIHTILSSGTTAVCLLAGAEFRDNKISSFVYEQRRHHVQINPRVLKVCRDASTVASAPSLSRSCPLKPCSSLASFWGQVCFQALSMTDFSIEITYIFALHGFLLQDIHIVDRALPSPSMGSKLTTFLTDKIIPDLFSIASFVLESTSSDIRIDVDGRFFAFLLRFIIENPKLSISEIVGDDAEAQFHSIWTAISGPTLDFTAFRAMFYDSLVPLPIVQTKRQEPYQLLPFHFKDSSLNQALSAAPVPSDVSEPSEKDTVFSDVHHWHNRKSILPAHLGGAKPKPLDERQRWRMLRSEQRFMAKMQSQAATLTGALGSALRQIVITPVGKKQVVTKPKVKQLTHGKAKKADKLSSADKLRLKIWEEKGEKDDVESSKWWSAQVEAMGKMSSSDRTSHLNRILRSPRASGTYIGLEMRLFSLDLDLRRWTEETDTSSSSVRDHYSISILQSIKDICRSWFLTTEVTKVVISVLSALGFPDSFIKDVVPNKELAKRELSFTPIKLFKSKTGEPSFGFMNIKEHSITWQLRLFGQFMDRSMDSAPDNRVAFDPDAWQRRVLDCIDDRSSLLVVAPTSAGKTFISFYAMEQVLRESDDGILVYVAPTKALVTQIATEVYARFTKNLPDGRSFWAIHTRDYRVHDSQKCQILVTVPEMLAIMLLSPPLAKTWTCRIKWIILDEIHSIGQQEGGAVWENIILLAPCPVIGLSATIGSPEVFNDWLQSVQTAKGFKHAFIEHPHRYSHLRKFYYDSPAPVPPSAIFTDLVSHQSTKRAKFLHPIATLSFGGRSIPPDLALEALDTLTLYNALFKHYRGGITDLDPITFFHSTAGFLTQKNILDYGAALKARLLTLTDSPDILAVVIQELQDHSSSQQTPSKSHFLPNLIYLLADLDSEGNLPAILFNFDRSDCEKIAQDLVKTLKTAEEKWRQNSPEWRWKIQEWEKWQNAAKEREKQATRMKKQKRDADAVKGSSEAESAWQKSFNPKDPSEQFSFAGVHEYSKSELDADIRDLGWTSTPRWAIDALRRGIAVHHAGMHKHYRSIVESLFRKKFVRVIIATGTLALGINAPTKTSVFCGDSPFLTALMFRQCAGRAGRRGYDLLGNVVFYGLPMDRVQRLILSKLPSLQPSFPLTSTLTLRLLNLLDGSDYHPVAVDALQSILALPHISFGSKIGKDQLLHHLRFSIEYLRRSRLIGQEGAPMNLFAIAAHLYYTEPSNFALVTLMRSSALLQICNQPSTIDARRGFILLMAHLFGRRYLPKAYVNGTNLADLIKKYPSCVVLPSLDEPSRQILLEHERETLRIYTSYAMAYVTEHADELGQDCLLPLTKLDFSGTRASTVSRFQQYLHESRVKFATRSAFVANSGHTDDFAAIEELTRTARSGLHLNGHVVPSFAHLTKKGEEEGHALNAYLFDFYVHGQVASLTNANGIRRGDLWYLLDDFNLTLAAIKAALEGLLQNSGTAELETLDDGDDMEDEGNEVDWALAGCIERPSHVTDDQWRVYEVVCGASAEFTKKFRAMWA